MRGKHIKGSDQGWQIAEKPRPGYDRHGPPRPYVSLNRRGEIALNPQAWAAINEPYNVTLLYDPARKQIGVKFPVSGDRHFFPVRRYGRGGKGKVVYAARLLKQFDLTITQTLTFRNPPLEYHQGHPMLILDLTKAEN